MDQLVAMRAFLRVAQTRSFNDAAKLEGLTQGTISKRVAALEEHLGVKLFLRNQRGISLTPSGDVYLEKCSQILGDVDSADAQIRSFAGLAAGTVLISMSPVLSRLSIAPLLVEFTRKNPRIEVVSFLTESHLDIVGEGIDVAVRARHLDNSSLIASKLSSNPLTLAASPDYLANSPCIETPGDLAHHACLTFSRMKAAQTWRFTRNSKTQDVQVTGPLSADQGDTLVEFAASGAGIVLMPEWVMADHLSKGSLVRLLNDWKPPSIPLYIVYARGATTPLRTRLLVDFIRRSVRSSGVLPK